MDRNKVIGYTKIAELAREAGLFSTESPVLMPKLERFAALIERELRVDAEPVVWVNKDGWIVGNDEGGTARPLYLHPAPAVVRQLVDALRMVMDDSDALDGRPRTYECVQEALAAAKDAWL